MVYFIDYNSDNPIRESEIVKVLKDDKGEYYKVLPYPASMSFKKLRKNDIYTTKKDAVKAYKKYRFEELEQELDIFLNDSPVEVSVLPDYRVDGGNGKLLLKNYLKDLNGEPVWFPKDGKPYFDRALRRTFNTPQEKKKWMDERKIVMRGDAGPSVWKDGSGDMKNRSYRRAMRWDD
jgi:hypothetical protein